MKVEGVKKERDLYVDSAKGICMLLILGIHTEAYVSVGMPLTFVAVPMFFFMSGFYDRSDYSLKDLLTKVFKSLIWPAIIWNVIGLFFNLVLNLLGNGTMETANLSFNVYCPNCWNGPVWFLIALSYAKIIVWLAFRWINKVIVVLVLSIMLGFLGNSYQMPMLIDEGLAAIPFYCAGKLLYPSLGQLKRNRILLILGIVAFILFSSGSMSFMINPTANGLYSHYYFVPMLCVMLSFVPILFLSDTLGGASLIKFGNNTLGVLVVHLPMCMIAARIAWRLFDRYSLEWYVLSFLFYILIVIASYYLSVFLKSYCPVLLRIR